MMNLAPHTAILGILLSMPVTLLAQWSDSSHVNNAVAPSSFDQVDARVVTDGSGGVIIAWREFRPSTGYDIFAARIDTMGYGNWPAGGVAICTTTTDVLDLRAAPDGRGGAVIAWREIRGASGYDLYAQRIDSNGVTLWTPGGVTVTAAAGTQDQPAIAGDRFGGVVLAWRDFRNGTDHNIFAQRIDSAGAAVWTPDGVSVCGTGEDQGDPQLGADGGGGATIAWEDYRSGTNFDVYAQRIDGIGTAAWIVDGVIVSFAAADQVNPRVVTDPGGRAVIAWEDSRSGTSWDLYAQRVNASGVLMWNANGEIVCTAAQSQGSADIADDGSGGAFIVWQDDRNTLSTDVYAQHFNGSGGPVWTPGGVAVCTATNHQFSPRVTPAGSGAAVFSWQDLRNGTDYDVFAQRINAAGTPAWTAGGRPIGTAQGGQLDPAIAGDGAGGAIIAWKDGRAGSVNGIFAQNVLAGGTLGSLPYILATSGPHGSASPAGVTAVAEGGSLTITFTPITGYHVDSVLVNGSYAGAPGSYTFENVGGDSTVHVVFAINVYTVTATAGAHGAISQPGATQVVHGQTQAYGITPDSGYEVGLLQIDGVETEPVTYYVFTNITTDHTIHAWFVNDSTALVPVAPRWNIVSVPLAAADFTTTALYPSATTVAYAFDGTYQAAPSMENGRGYWLKFDTTEVVAIAGGPVSADTIDVIDGWNMIGSIASGVPVAEIGSIPGGIVTSSFYAYAAGYTPASLIRPGRGYWVKVAQAGQLILSATPSASPENRISIVPSDEQPPAPPGGDILTVIAGSGGGDGSASASPAGFRLDRNYPNPFNPSTVLHFELPSASDVRMEIFSVTGERVARLIDGRLSAGPHELRWDATGLPGGFYFCRLSAGGNHATQKLLLIK
jgi:hypothetical protein